MMQSGTIEDRLGIRELIERSTIGVMRKDAALWGGTWAEDGRWKLPSMAAAVEGRSAIASVFAEKMAFIDFMSMSATPAELAFDGDRATGKAYCHESIQLVDGSEKSILGCYHDEYVRVDGTWLFQAREYEIIGQR